MTPDAASIQVERREGRHWVALLGELDVAGAERLRECLGDLLRQEPDEIVIDLTRTEFVDSLGLSGLLHCGREAHLAHVPLRVHAPHGHQARVLMDLSGTAGALRVMPE